MGKRSRRYRLKRRLAALGWTLAVLGLLAYIANEFSVDVPAVHYGLLGLMLTGAWLGFRNLG